MIKAVHVIEGTTVVSSIVIGFFSLTVQWTVWHLRCTVNAPWQT